MKDSLKKLMAFAKPYKVKYYASIFFSIIYVLARTSQPLFIGMIISELSRNMLAKMQTGVGGVNFDYISKMVMILVITGIFDALGDYISNYLLSEAVQDTTLNLRRNIYSKLNRLPVSYFDSRQQGEILSRVTTDITIISEAIQQTLLTVLSAILTLLFSVGFMFWISPFFAALSLILYPICILTFKHLYKKGQSDFKELQDVLGEMNGYTQEYYSGHSVVQLFGQEEQCVDGFREVNGKLNKIGFKANFTSSTINPLISSVMHLGYISLFLLLAITVLEKPLIIGGIVVAGVMPIGSIQAFIQYIWQANGPISRITQLSNLFQSATASLTRVIELLEEEEDTDVEETLELEKQNVKGAIQFKDVQFGYSSDKLLMDGINIDVKSGDTIAVVGPTGAGKTTLINLLMRFYDLNGGKITIDGISIDEMSKRQSRDIFAMVDQVPWLYSTTIEENIKFGKLDATYEEVVEVAKLARADHFIRTLPDGYRTIINEESSNVSQGEKQLVTIARALIKNPEILILDEATSSVDTRIEQLLQQAMDEAMKGRTSFIIAHRLSTIRNADLILVMNNGSIVEQGNHDSLIEQGGIYKDLYESQFME